MGQRAASGRTAHRASYLLERGTWRATCRECGWQVDDPDRRRATARFRAHIAQAKVIDLRGSGIAAPSVDAR